MLGAHGEMPAFAMQIQSHINRLAVRSLLLASLLYFFMVEPPGYLPICSLATDPVGLNHLKHSNYSLRSFLAPASGGG